MRNIRKGFQTPSCLKSARPNLQRSLLGPKCELRLCNMHIPGASGEASLYKPPFRSQGVLGESFGRLLADAASLLAGFAALGGIPQGWAFLAMGGVRVRPLALTRAFGGPKMLRNGDANWSREAAWGQEAAPSAPVVFANNICKHTWFWLAESTSSNATKHHIIVTHKVFKMC